MNNTINRFVGLLLIIAAIGGMAFSVLGLIGVWQYQSAAIEAMNDTIELVSDTLTNTADGLVITQEALLGAVSSINALEDTLATTAKTIQSTEPAVESIVTLLEEDLPETIEATSRSLATAQESAKVIDNVLDTLNRIPLININYNPETPLHIALGQVAQSVDDMPNTLTGMADSLKDTQRNLEVIQVDLAYMKESISQIETSLEQSEKVIAAFQQSVDTLQIRLAKFKAKLPKIVELTAWGLYFFLIWMGIAQLGLFIQGRELFLRREDPAGNSKEITEE